MHPLASLAGARDAIRAKRAGGALNEPVQVIFADGEYALIEAVEFNIGDGGTAEHPVTFQAAPGAKPRFFGGRRITVFKWARWSLDGEGAGGERRKESL
jgi:hypothetical protein